MQAHHLNMQMERNDALETFVYQLNFVHLFYCFLSSGAFAQQTP